MEANTTAPKIYDLVSWSPISCVSAVIACTPAGERFIDNHPCVYEKGSGHPYITGPEFLVIVSHTGDLVRGAIARGLTVGAANEKRVYGWYDAECELHLLQDGA